MEFIDNEHKQFYEEKLNLIGKGDVYRRALIYTLAICPVTREHFTDIFNIKEGLINRNSLQRPYQTSTSLKVTRAAFSLWNGNNYDSDEDLENGVVSTHYNISDIFCCSYAQYIYEAVKLRYPEYTATNTNNVLENTLTNVIKLVRSKYSNVVEMLIQENKITLEYMYHVEDERDCYQIMTVQELDNKLSIEFLTQHISKVIDIQELEDIFEMLHRQSTQKKYTKEDIKAIKGKYIAGTKIRLIKMYDLQAVPPQTVGTVTKVDDAGQIHIDWENGSTLALNVGVDEFEIIENN